MAESLLLASTPSVELPAEFRRGQKLRMKWVGYDGSVWDFSSASSGVFLVRDGCEGLGYPDIHNFVTSSPVVNGVQWDGFTVTGRKVFWALMVYHDGSSMDWINYNKAFFRTLNPGRTGTWIVTTPDGVDMTLTLRLADGADSTTIYSGDPVKRGWCLYGIELFPEQPLWEGEIVHRTWQADTDPVNYLGPTGYGPPFYIVPSNNLGTAFVVNEGDAETYVQWTIKGPADTPLMVGLAGRETPIPFDVPVGSTLILDTDPTKLTAELDGVDVMGQIPDFDTSPLLPQETVSLSLQLQGGGQIQATFKQLFYRRI